MFKEISYATYASDPHYLGNSEGGAVWGDLYYALIEFSDGRRFQSNYAEKSKELRCHEDFEWYQDVAHIAAAKVDGWLKSLDLSEFGYTATLADHFREVDPCYGSSAFQFKEATEGAFLDQ
jgi:hypothetical protein|tara:strand:+ start:354 stop:716 length:363 start_codon:yes stop_codon:yes gene_type:complete